MRPRTSHFPAHALTTFAPMLPQTKEARVFRRAQAVHAVGAGHPISAVSATFHVAQAALRPWVQRLAPEGPQGLRERPRSRKPAHRHRRVGATPQSPRRASSPGARLPPCPREWPRTRHRAHPPERGATGPCKRPRYLKKKARRSCRPTGRLAPPQLLAPLALWHSLPWRPGHVEVRASGSMKTQRAGGAGPGPGWASGAAPHESAGPPARCPRAS
jgi:hypothetical protein